MDIDNLIIEKEKKLKQNDQYRYKPKQNLEI
jgi:hypothetical protein